MPTYQYACTECGEQLEVVQKFTDDPLTVCPACGGKLRKVFSPVGIVFKGPASTGPTAATARGARDGKDKTEAKDKQRTAPATALPARLADSGSSSDKSGSGDVEARRRRRRRRSRRPAAPSSTSVRRSPEPRCPARASIGVIGGSGFYEFLDVRPTRSRSRPRSARPATRSSSARWPGGRWRSCPGTAAITGSRRTSIPYRANLWALRSLGVRQVLAPERRRLADPAYGPGTLVIPDQLVDRTTGRAQTYYDAGGAVHVPFADPYCPRGRAARHRGGRAASGWDAGRSGTLVVIEGPRFSTRAESRWYAAQGWTLVGMTGHPEAVLARELALCYTTLALVTDTDAGVEEGEGVTQDEVFRVFGGERGPAARARHDDHRGPARRTRLPVPARA